MSLLTTEETYYRDSRFADVWADVEAGAEQPSRHRCPRSPARRRVEARVVKDVRVDWPRSDLSVAGRVVSIPVDQAAAAEPASSGEGRWIDPLRRDEIIVNVGFAETWSIAPGDPIEVILNGRMQAFRVVGIAHSPEFVYASRPGNPLPDDRTFVVLWASEDAVAAAFDMEGAFNNLAVSLAPGASAASVIAALDHRLDPYGAPGAYERRDQPSHRFLSDELAEQRTLAITVPVVFFGIAAFLLNVVLGRLVEAQREQIAALKALGFPTLPIGVHYVKFVAVVCSLGSVAGVLAGIWYGHGMLNNYRPFFRFPELAYTFPPWLPFTALAVSFGAAVTGVLASVRRVLRLTPAEAMRPPTPAAFSRTLAGGQLRPEAKMVMRGIVGRPLRSLLTIVGLAFAVPMIVLGLFWWDALDYMVAVQFDGIERGDAFVTFTDPLSGRAIREIGRIPGVLAVEGQRIVPVRLRAGHRTYRIALTGLAEESELRVPRDSDLAALSLPSDGVLISTGLAERLGIGIGSNLTVEVLEGERPVHQLPVTALVDEMLGYSVYMEIGSLNRLMREGDLVSHAALRVDPALAPQVWRRLAEFPRLVSTSVKAVWLRVFDEKIAGMVVISALVLTAFGLIIAVGVVYNSARIALQERAWELASLRILGFSRAEVSRILLAELGIEMLIAIPVGLAMAQGIVGLLLGLRDTETFRIPAVISTATFASAALTVLAAGVVSALLVRRRIDRLDLVAVLKTRD